MSQVTVSWDMSGAVNSAQVPGNTQVTISGGDAGFVSQTMSVASSPAVFTSVPPEVDQTALYTVTVQLFDNSPSPVAIGKPASATFSVAAPLPTVATPANVAVSVV